MNRLYRFAGDNPELFGGTALRVILDDVNDAGDGGGGRVVLDVGDNPGPIEHGIHQAEGWALLAVDVTVDDLPAQIPRSYQVAVDAVIADRPTDPLVKALSDETSPRPKRA